jgi:hypothetical protein
LPVWKNQPKNGTPSRWKPSSAAMYGVAQNRITAPSTKRTTSPVRLVRRGSGRPRLAAQAVSATARPTPTTAQVFDHFGSRWLGVWTPGKATVAQRAKATRARI